MAINNSWACIGVAILTASGDEAASLFEQAILSGTSPKATLSEKAGLFREESGTPPQPFTNTTNTNTPRN